MSRLHDRTFAELYCETNGLTAEQYPARVLAETLYPHARMVAPLLKLLSPAFFSADIEFVQSVGQLRRFREYFAEADDFAHHPLNRGFWRVTLNLRVSSRRLRRLVRRTLHPASTEPDETGADSSVPFGGVDHGRSGERASRAVRSQPATE